MSATGSATRGEPIFWSKPPPFERGVVPPGEWPKSVFGFDPIGCGDARRCSDPLCSADLVGSADPVGPGDAMGCGGPMGSNDPVGCSDTMGGGDPMDSGHKYRAVRHVLRTGRQESCWCVTRRDIISRIICLMWLDVACACAGSPGHCARPERPPPKAEAGELGEDGGAEEGEGAGASSHPTTESLPDEA